MIVENLHHVALVSRSPYGERGLKYLGGRGHAPLVLSLSLRRAWIEISISRSSFLRFPRRSPYGERGLKYFVDVERGGQCLSLSLRRAWIEIWTDDELRQAFVVALLTESVD